MKEDHSDLLQILKQDDAYQLTYDSRVVAIRWDLVPWGLVLDLDVPSSKENNSPMHRAWLVFLDISEIFWPFNNSRLPNGCWLTSDISIKNIANKKTIFKMHGLLPSFDEHDKIVGQYESEITLRASKLIGLLSRKTAIRCNGTLQILDRRNIAPDNIMELGLKNAIPTND